MMFLPDKLCLICFHILGMSQNWEYSRAKYSETEVQLGHLANNVLGKLYPNIGENVAININLYVFLLNNIKRADADLAKSITQHGKPVFSVKTIGEIKRKIQKHKGFIRVQTGGGGGDTRNGFWDKMIRKLTSQIRMPPIGTYILWWLHILYHLEQQDLYGPLLSQMLDTFTLSLPVIAELAESVTGKIIGLMPIPYAGMMGDGLGYIVSLFFIIIAIVVNNSRKHFGAAFVVALDGVPLLGETLSLAAINFEKGADRYEIYKDKMVKSVGKISPSAGKVIYSYAPDTKIHTEPLPPIDTDKIGDEIMAYTKQQTGLNTLENKVSGLTDKLKVPDLQVPELKVPELKVPELKVPTLKIGGGIKRKSRRKRNLRRKTYKLNKN